ncbi:YbgA family protein [Nitrosopumilus sp.]|uniref:YbgA family protein n=1 Tax=Nitrosopumilus sp. TaxID=2024843 RepID=UPI00260962FC|nr:YbgA family protein [Nitrosopumilus sp.]
MSKNLEANNKIKVSEEEIREFVLERFENIKISEKMKDLVEFHTANKFMLMAHDQTKLKILGNIVSNSNKSELKEIIDEYEKHLKEAFISKPTTKSHSNVIMHIFGFFSANLNKFEKREFLNLLQQFREEKITIGNILAEINPIIYQFNKTYLAGQTYFLLYTDKDSGNLF